MSDRARTQAIRNQTGRKLKDGGYIPQFDVRDLYRLGSDLVLQVEPGDDRPPKRPSEKAKRRQVHSRQHRR